MYAYPAQKLALKGVDTIQITGVKGHLALRGRAGENALNLKVRHSRGARFEDWHLSIERRGKVLYIEVFNAAYGTQWRNSIRPELWPEFDIELEGASRPTTISWNEGKLDFNGWQADLDVAFLKGEAFSQNGRGHLSLQPVQAKVSVKGQRGPIRIKGDSGEVHLEKTLGPLDLNWLSGEISLVDCQGSIHVESRDSKLNVRGGGGVLEVSLDKGQGSVTDFVGKVRAHGERARWLVAAKAPSDVDIKSASGPVTLNWLAGGARVYLSSTLGTISQPPVPGHLTTWLHPSAREGRRVLEGRRTSKNMGQVFVRTDSGAIEWTE